ncbi:hypothetical protein [Secundilactobacillus silagei]|uniref:hypothetical protein n=1 Tax=Secundilactobacillus silagei TaxID=1293415 RepID=UPI0006D12C7A|nr:hypothetical protein [Secundilactobacillus silagei]
MFNSAYIAEQLTTTKALANHSVAIDKKSDPHSKRDDHYLVPDPRGFDEWLGHFTSREKNNLIVCLKALKPLLVRGFFLKIKISICY